MSTANKKEKKSEVIVLDNLKTSNLPELIGWKEKQENLVKENPFVEITDTKTYEKACKSRTNLVKGRTELQNQEKTVASKLATFRKDVGTETEKLISITKPHEEKQQEEVKRWEDRKALEKKNAEEAEANRVQKIKNKLEEIETESYKIIQGMTFPELESKSNEVKGLIKQDDFDFEEYDILFDQVVNRVELSLESKINTLTKNEEQRLANERLEEEAKQSRAREALQNKRLNEILPYISFGDPVDVTKLHAVTEEEYLEVFKSKKFLFDEQEKAKQEAEKERLEKEQEEREAIFEIRKKRLEEAGMIYTEEHVDYSFYTDLNPGYIILAKDVYDETTLEFEDTLVEVKNHLKGIIDKKERKAKREKLFFDAGMPLGEDFELLKIGDFTLTKFSAFDSIDEDFEEILEDAKKAFFKFRSSSIEMFGYKLNEENSMFEMEGFLSYPKEMALLSTTDFDYWLSTVKEQVDDTNNKLAEADAAKLRAENKARIAKYATDKKLLIEFIESLDFRNAVPELENSDLNEVLSVYMDSVNEFKTGAIESIKNF